jgi:hypothetical protein
MPTQAIAAIGSSLKSTGVEIPELTSVGAIGLTTTLVDTTALDSNGYSSQIPTLQSGGTIPCIGNYVPNNSIQNGLRLLQNSRVSGPFVFTYPNALGTASFSAFVANWKLQPITPTTALQFTFDLVVDGAITYA